MKPMRTASSIGATIETAARPKRPIEATLRLTDKKGGPLCASVKPEHVEWRL